MSNHETLLGTVTRPIASWSASFASESNLSDPTVIDTLVGFIGTELSLVLLNPDFQRITNLVTHVYGMPDPLPPHGLVNDPALLNDWVTSAWTEDSPAGLNCGGPYPGGPNADVIPLLFDTSAEPDPVSISLLRPGPFVGIVGTNGGTKMGLFLSSNPALGFNMLTNISAGGVATSAGPTVNTTAPGVSNAHLVVGDFPWWAIADYDLGNSSYSGLFRILPEYVVVQVNTQTMVQETIQGYDDLWMQDWVPRKPTYA
jgi:hypothetical protein